MSHMRAHIGVQHGCHNGLALAGLAHANQDAAVQGQPRDSKSHPIDSIESPNRVTQSILSTQVSAHISVQHGCHSGLGGIALGFT